MWVDSPSVNEPFRALQDALLGYGAARLGTLLESDSGKLRLWQSGSPTQSNGITQRFHDQVAGQEFASRPAPG